MSILCLIFSLARTAMVHCYFSNLGSNLFVCVHFLHTWRIRGFTYGYDYYAPEKSVLFHYYDRPKKIGAKKAVEKASFWEHSDLYENVAHDSMIRLEAIIGTDPNIVSSKWNHIDETKYGIGRVRMLDKYFETFGINVRDKTTEPNLCNFVGAPMHNLFAPHLRQDGMGIDYEKIKFRYVNEETAEE